MDKDKFQELFEAKALAEQELEKMRTPVTILFSDIKGSTRYFEKYGDVAGMAMIERHNRVLFPVIARNGGWVVKTIGDSIMASFADPVSAVKTAVEMQQTLETDRAGQMEDDERIRIRIGVHSGLGLIKDNDIFGDVVNAAARIQDQTEADQILISQLLLEPAKQAGYQCAHFGKAELKGKAEPIDVYAVAWSESATEDLIEGIQARFDAKFREFRRRQSELEEEFENSRDQWRAERRKLVAEIEQLEEALEHARQEARTQIADDLRSEIRFQLDEAIRTRDELQQQLVDAQAKWDSERNALKAQIAAMQASVIEGMERSNNPARMALAIRDQVDTRLAKAKQEWQLQWDAERRRLNAEVERWKKAGEGTEKKDLARRALLEKLGKAGASDSAPGTKTAELWQKEFEDARLKWQAERDQLLLRIKQLERDVQRGQENIRAEAYQDIRNEYEPKAESTRKREQLEQEIQSLLTQLHEERERWSLQVAEFQQSIPAAQEASKKQALAELQIEFDTKLEESQRMRIRAERKVQDILEESEAERRRSKRQIEELEDQLKEAQDTALRATRQSRGTM